MSDQTSRSVRLRYTATGALAALAAAGAIAGTVALADSPPSVPGKTGASPPSATPQPFLNAVQRLVENGTISGSEGQAVDREIQTGQVDTDTLAAARLTSAQLEAVQQALANTKRSLAATPLCPSK